MVTFIFSSILSLFVFAVVAYYGYQDGYYNKGAIYAPKIENHNTVRTPTIDYVDTHSTFKFSEPFNLFLMPIVDGALSSLVGSIIMFFIVYTCMKKTTLTVKHIFYSFLTSWGVATIFAALLGYSGNIVFLVLIVNVITSFTVVSLLYKQANGETIDNPAYAGHPMSVDSMDKINVSKISLKK